MFFVSNVGYQNSYHVMVWESIQEKKYCCWLLQQMNENIIISHAVFKNKSIEYVFGTEKYCTK